MALTYNSDKFDSCLNTYRDKMSYNLSVGSTDPDQKHEASTMMPLDFSLEMDGIAGIIPNSAFEVPSNVLPNSYLTKIGHKSKIAFILHTVDHNFNNNKWTTKITGQTLNIRFDSLTPQEKAARELLQLQNTLSTSNDEIFDITPDDYPPNISKNIVETIPALSKLKNLIGFHESNNNYGIANTGGNAKRSVINVNGLTFDTLKRQQQIADQNNDQRVFAAGRFQIIPTTMDAIKSSLGLKGTDRFDPKTQERMGDWLVLENRSALGNYIKGKNSGTAGELTSAIDSIGYIWASMPVVIKSGNRTKVGDVVTGAGQAGNYGGSGKNPSKAKVSIKLMANTIISARIAYSSKKPSFVPTYYNAFV